MGAADASMKHIARVQIARATEVSSSGVMRRPTSSPSLCLVFVSFFGGDPPQKWLATHKGREGSPFLPGSPGNPKSHAVMLIPEPQAIDRRACV